MRITQGQTGGGEASPLFTQFIRQPRKLLKTHAPRIKAIRPQASYLVWLDCRELGLNQEALNDFFADKAHLALNDGAMFGKEGTGYMRLNVASPRSVIEQAMKQLAEAYQAMSF